MAKMRGPLPAGFETIDETRMPKHVAIIMDGNGRWAKQQGKMRTTGHRAGMERMVNIVRVSSDIGLDVLTLYAFSTENWKRPKDEVDALMKLFDQYIDDVREFFDLETKLIFLGDKERFTPELREKMLAVERDTAHFDKMTMMIAINYGGRDEIVHAARQVAQLAKDGQLDPDTLTEEQFAQYLYTAGVPDVDLLIRPSGELRLSNYMIWQCAYAEFYFTNVLWPDFSPKELDKALIDFAGRGRRFGGV